MTTSAISLCFRYSEGDYTRALRAHYASRLRLWLDIPAIVVTGIAGVYFWRSPDLHWVSIVSMSASGLLLLILALAFIVIPPIAFRREPKFRDQYTLAFSQEGIHFTTAHIDSQLQWSIYSKALIDAHSYVLYYGRSAFTVIPKRVFPNEDQQRAFDQLLTQHVPKIVRK
jgi:hypothetical protein